MEAVACAGEELFGEFGAVAAAPVQEDYGVGVRVRGFGVDDVEGGECFHFVLFCSVLFCLGRWCCCGCSDDCLDVDAS